MPLTINVGLNRKASKDYQSTGASINLTAELDQSLLTRPDELQGAVSELYEQAEVALDRQVGGGATAPLRGERFRNGASGNGNGRSHGNGRPDPANGRGMTQSQRKAIHAIAGQLGVDAGGEARHAFGIDLDRASTLPRPARCLAPLAAISPAAQPTAPGSSNSIPTPT